MAPTLLTRREALQRIGLALGGIATAPVLAGVLGGCRTPSGDAAASYTYQALDESQQRRLAALVDRIIPATDTPGAAEAGVPQFIDKMLAEWYAPEQRDAFLAGLDYVDRRAQADGQTSFADLDEEAQTALVVALDTEAFAPADPAEVSGDVAAAGRAGTFQAREQQGEEVAGTQGEMGEAMEDEADRPAAEDDTAGTRAPAGPPDAPPFFRQLKELTLAGYYTSEIGATQELRWSPAPGRYDADVPFSEIGRAWA